MASRIVQYFADKLKTIKEYPITLTKAVYDENGNRLDNLLTDVNATKLGGKLPSEYMIKADEEAKNWGFGTIVDLAPYTSTEFTCPSDGIAFLLNNSTSLGLVYINNLFYFGGLANGSWCCYVKKGTRLKVANSPQRVRFYPYV